MKSIGSRILLAVGLLVAATVGVQFCIQHLQHKNVLRMQMMQIGEELVQSTNSVSLVRIGPDLQWKLNEFLASKAHVSKVVLGDDPNVGDGKATGRIILTNSKGAAIGIRLREDGSSNNKFHVLGFWTVHEEDPALSSTQKL